MTRSVVRSPWKRGVQPQVSMLSMIVVFVIPVLERWRHAAPWGQSAWSTGKVLDHREARSQSKTDGQ